MHVVLTCNFSPWSPYSGGGQRSTHSIAVHLARRGHRVDVVYTRPPWEIVNAPRGLPYRVTWAALPARHSAAGLWLRNVSALSVRRAVSRLLGPDTVVHANGEEGAALCRLRQRHPFPLVLTPRYPRYPERQLSAPAGRGPTLAHLVLQDKYAALAWVLRDADRVFPTSRSSAEEIARRFALSPERMTVVPNGVAPAFFAAAPARREERAILFLGRLEHSKGVLTLIDALCQLPSDVTCTFVGRGAAETELRRRSQASNLAARVELVPWSTQEELAERLARAAVVCLPSLEESFGNAVAEAMACGAPVVSTLSGSVPELIRHRETGYLVPPSDAWALTRELDWVLGHPEEARRAGEAARREVTKRYRWEGVVSQYEPWYERLLRGDTPRSGPPANDAVAEAPPLVGQGVMS